MSSPPSATRVSSPAATIKNVVAGIAGQGLIEAVAGEVDRGGAASSLVDSASTLDKLPSV